MGNEVQPLSANNTTAIPACLTGLILAYLSEWHKNLPSACSQVCDTRQDTDNGTVYSINQQILEALLFLLYFIGGGLVYPVYDPQNLRCAGFQACHTCQHTSAMICLALLCFSLIRGRVIYRVFARV